MTTILTASTLAQLNADISQVNEAATGTFIIDLDGEIVNDAGGITAFRPQSGVSLTIDGNGNIFDNADGYRNPFIVYGPVSTLTFENLVIQNTAVAPPPQSSGLFGTQTITSTETHDQTSDIMVGGTGGAGVINNQGTYEIDQLTAGDTGGVLNENYGPTIYDGGFAGDLFINSGTLIKLDNADDFSGVSEIYVDVNSTSTISVPDPDSNLRFDGANNSFSGTYIGGGMIDYGDPLTPGYGTETLGNIDMTDGACTTSWATINQNGELTLSYSTTINSNGTWNFTSDNGMLLDGLSNDADGFAQFNVNVVTKTGGAGTTLIGVPFNISGPYSAAIVTTGTLQFDGGVAEIDGQLKSEPNEAGPNTFASPISGAGIFGLGGGGADLINSGTTITTAGWTVVDAGTDVTLDTALSYSGTFTEGPGAILTLNNNLALTINSEGTDTFSGSVSGSGSLAVAFGGSNGTLQIFNLASAPGGVQQTDFPGTIENFAIGDLIRTEGFGNFTTINAATPTYNSGLNITSLALKDGGSLVATLTLAGNYSADVFAVRPDSQVSGAADVFFCFMQGTRVRTPEGAAAIETLQRGDLIVTADGRTMPVKWIGRQTISTLFGDPLRVLPIRVKANALSARVPSRDLLVSPDHALLVDDVLIQAAALVNGTSIVRESSAPETFTYYHIELDDHSLILAENTPAETFVDNADRLSFDNWREYEALYPEGRSIVEMPYPRAKSYRQVPQSIRGKLARRAAMLMSDAHHVAA